MRLLNIPNTEKTYSLMFLRQTLSCYHLKIVLAKFVKVLVLELFYGTRTRVHFSILVLVLVLEVFCGTRTRKLSTPLHHCWLVATPLPLRALSHGRPLSRVFTFMKKFLKTLVFISWFEFIIIFARFNKKMVSHERLQSRNLNFSS